MIAIGASTGGTEAIKTVINSFPENMPPIVITQHMPAGFTASFASRLNSMCKLTVEEFTSGKRTLLPKHVYIANGDEHLGIKYSGGVFTGYTMDTEPVNRHRPSVDVMFNTLAEAENPSVVAMLLTGMGVDGAAGLGRMKTMGALTIAQDEKTSVVWGMPRAAVEQDAASRVLPINKIGPFVTRLCYPNS